MQQDTSPAPDWYDDPENPGTLRYWDGTAWTDARAVKGGPEVAPQVQAAKPVKQPKQPAFKVADDEQGGPSFALVVAGVLGVATLLIAAITAVTIWISSYNTGHDRGEQARQQGITHDLADKYCHDAAKKVSQVGSADGSWDTPWIIGCKRGIG